MDRKYSELSRTFFFHPYALAGVLPVCFFLLFYFYPVSGILIKSFFSSQTSFTEALAQFTQSRRLLKVVGFTFWQAALSTGVTLVCALPCCYILSHYEFFGKKAIRTAASIPFVLPAVVVAAAFQACLNDRFFLPGVKLNHPLAMIILAHLFYNFSVMLRIITGFWSSIEGRIKEAACTLGAGPINQFRYITLPLLMPAIFAASTLVFIFCFSSFGIILILGGPSYSSIETEIYRQAAHMFNLPMASLLSLLQICFTIALMWLYTRLTKQAAKFSPSGNDSSFKLARTIPEKLMIAAFAVFIFCLCVLPLITLVFHSFFHNGKFTLLYYSSLFINLSDSVFYIPPFNAIGYSLLFAGTALVIALVTGCCAALFIRHIERNLHTKWVSVFDPIFMLPLSTSAVTLGFGIIITLDKPPLNLRTSLFLIPIAHALVGFPFVIRTVLPVLKSIPESLTDAAAALGASPVKTFFLVELPLLSKSIIAAAIFAFTISLGEFGATIFTARPETPTIPIAIYRFLGQPGALNYGQAMAISTLLMVVTAAGFVFIESFRKEQHREI